MMCCKVTRACIYDGSSFRYYFVSPSVFSSVFSLLPFFRPFLLLSTPPFHSSSFPLLVLSSPFHSLSLLFLSTPTSHFSSFPSRPPTASVRQLLRNFFGPNVVLASRVLHFGRWAVLFSIQTWHEHERERQRQRYKQI